MKIIFSDQCIPKEITKSIFLAGPSPRDKTTFDWRHDAVAYLKEMNFDGTVFIPTPEDRFYGGDDSSDWSYDNQIKWECDCRHVADIIVFWIPRSVKGGMPAFVTNIEFGEDLSSGKIVYGRPDTAERCSYLDKRYSDLGYVFFNTLESTLNHAVSELKDGSYRTNGEVYVPLFIWNSQPFQEWYSKVKKVGNRLDYAKVLHHFKIKNKHLFSFILQVKIWIESEQRYKENEFVFSRKNISTVLAYHKSEQDTHIVLVKEFRSSVNNSEGFVYELPGGSAVEEINALTNAQHELSEETGLFVSDIDRFKYVGSKQVAATLSSYKCDLYKVELTDTEISLLIKNSKENETFGAKEDSEKTYISIVSLKELGNYPVDFAALGMIYSANL